MAKRIREKAKARQEAKDTRPTATAKYIRISPSKARVVMNVVRGKSVPEAIAILENTPKAASASLVKLINSAAANAENGKGLTKDELYVAELRADAGPDGSGSTLPESSTSPRMPMHEHIRQLPPAGSPSCPESSGAWRAVRPARESGRLRRHRRNRA